MDELELLKQDWSKQDDKQLLSYNELYQMLLKKSSSIVKWIFKVSVLEFLIWSSLDILFRVGGMYDNVNAIDLGMLIKIAPFFSYGILIYFSVRFYINYKKIKATDSAKQLMQTIMNVRKTVKQYVWITISFFVLMIFYALGYLVFYSDEFKQIIIDNDVNTAVLVGVTLLTTVVFVLLIALFYRVLYGFFTRKLGANYIALEKIEG